LNIQPHRGGLYNDVLANDTYLVDVVKRLYYMISGWWSFGPICIKPILSYIFPNQNILIIEKDFSKKGTWLNHHEHLKRVHG
jgi:hypothetical protein